MKKLFSLMVVVSLIGVFSYHVKANNSQQSDETVKVVIKYFSISDQSKLPEMELYTAADSMRVGSWGRGYNTNTHTLSIELKRGTDYLLQYATEPINLYEDSDSVVVEGRHGRRVVGRSLKDVKPLPDDKSKWMKISVPEQITGDVYFYPDSLIVF